MVTETIFYLMVIATLIIYFFMIDKYMKSFIETIKFTIHKEASKLQGDYDGLQKMSCIRKCKIRRSPNEYVEERLKQIGYKYWQEQLEQETGLEQIETPPDDQKCVTVDTGVCESCLFNDACEDRNPAITECDGYENAMSKAVEEVNKESAESVASKEFSNSTFPGIADKLE